MKPIDEYLYHYKANVVKVYDGDTITVNISLGFGVWMNKQKVRLFGIDTPELRGDEREEGLRVRDYVRSLILGKEVHIKSIRDKSGKYGRWLAEVYVEIDGQLVHINQSLLDMGMAKRYE